MPLRLTGKQLLAALSSAGFSITRIKGSPHILRTPMAAPLSFPFMLAKLSAPVFWQKSSAIAT